MVVIVGCTGSNEGPGSEPRGAGDDRHDQRGQHQRPHLLPGLLQARPQEVSRGKQGGSQPGTFQGFHSISPRLLLK